MAEGAVVTPLTGENLVPQGVRRDAIEPPQQASQRAQIKPTKRQLQGQIEEKANQGYTTIEQLAQASLLMQLYIYTNGSDKLDNPYTRMYVQQAINFANSHGERMDAFTELKGLLEQVLQGITAIHTTTQISQSSETGTSDSAIMWKAFQTQAWQTAVRSAASPQSQSAGSSTPSVSHAELGMDCEIVVKIRDDSERALVKKLQPKDIVNRAERARAHAAKRSGLGLVGVNCLSASTKHPPAKTPSPRVTFLSGVLPRP